jgi:hypothetical protein
MAIAHAEVGQVEVPGLTGVAFFVRAEGRDIYLLGGNQHNSVCILPYPTTRLLGLRWPSEASSVG